MDRKISELSVEEFKKLIQEIIHNELENFDPDEGLELRYEVREDLKKYNSEKTSGKLDLIDSEEVFKKLGS